MNISDEGKALSDADTLFKSLPVTPVIFATKYLSENKLDLVTLAEKIVIEQSKLMEDGIYFYTEIAKSKYLHWAVTNINLWKNIYEAIQDQDIQHMLKIAEDAEVIESIILS